jgi:uncharacterized protein
MKKNLLSTLLLLVLVALLTACGESEEVNSSTEEGEAEEKLEAPDRFLRIGSGPMGSGWYPITTILSETYMDNFSNLNVSQLEGGSVSNLRAMEVGDIEMSINFTSDFADALNGSGTFDEALTKPTGMASLYPVYQTIATLADNNSIESIEDIVDKHIFLGPQDGGGPVAFWRMMEEYEIDEDMIRSSGGNISYGNYSDGASMLTDGNVDVIVAGGAPQVQALQEIELTRAVKVIPIDEDKLKSIDEKGYGISYDNLPAGSYKGLDEEIPTYTTVAMLTISSELPDSYVYDLTKLFWENMSTFEEQVPTRAVDFTLETVFDGVDPDTLHPGARQYYEEIGAVE